jgi:predicted secreted protein
MTTRGGFGVQFKIDIAEVATAIVDVLEGDLPKFVKALAEMTGHDAAGGYAKHVATGKRSIESFNLTIGWDADEATHAAVLAAFDSNDPVDMEVITPGADETLAGSAHFFEIGRVSEQEDGFKAEVAIQPTGQWTVT